MMQVSVTGPYQVELSRGGKITVTQSLRCHEASIRSRRSAIAGVAGS
jgi:hypothetical protein